jgi:hypothetical protein
MKIRIPKEDLKTVILAMTAGLEYFEGDSNQKDWKKTYKVLDQLEKLLAKKDSFPKMKITRL